MYSTYFVGILSFYIVLTFNLKILLIFCFPIYNLCFEPFCSSLLKYHDFYLTTNINVFFFHQKNLIFLFQLKHLTKTFFALRCCGVLLQEPKKKESLFQQYQKEIERWEIEEKQGKTWAQFKQEFGERRLKGKELKKYPTDGKGVLLADSIKSHFQTKFPRFSKVFFFITDGISDLFSDFKSMVSLYYNLRREKINIQDFNLRELELLYEIFIYLKRMIPLCVFAILPFGNIVIIAVAYMQPLKFLTPHFWTDEQKATFIKQQHANRVAVFLPIIQYLDVNLPKEDNSELVSKFRESLLLIQNGQVPNSTELASFKELFVGEQMFAMQKLSASHLDNMLTLHGQKAFLVKVNRLEEWASYLHLVDRYINQNGGVTTLTSKQLASFCFQRGVNANAMNEEEMKDYLKQWMAFSELISSDYISLLLHAPAFIGFNHRSNQSITVDKLL